MRSRRITVALLVAVASLLLSSIAGAADPVPPANDDIANAAVISLPYAAMGTTYGATQEDGEYTNCNTPRVQTVWYSYTATTAELLLFEVSSDEFDPVVWVFKGPEGAGAGEVTPVHATCGSRSDIFSTVPGTTYYFMVSTYSGWIPEYGDFDFRVIPLDNQDFADATVLDGLPAYARGANWADLRRVQISDERNAIPIEFVDGLEEGEPQPCGAIGFTMWYRMTLGVDAPMTANTFDVSGDLIAPITDAADGAARTTFDTVLAVYSGPADATFDDLTLLGCNDDSGQGVSRVDFAGTTGTTYYFQVGGFGGGFYFLNDYIASGPMGMYDLTVSALCRDKPATIVGTNGDDILIGTRRTDVIAGLGGNDTITGRRAQDFLCGGPGNDVLSGGAGGDRLLGGGGADSLFGNTGNDSLWGGPGLDSADGGPKYTDRCSAELEIGCEI